MIIRGSLCHIGLMCTHYMFSSCTHHLIGLTEETRRLGGETDSVSREKEGDHIWTTDWVRERARGGGWVEHTLSRMNHCPTTHTHTHRPSPYLPFPKACCTLQRPLPYSCRPPFWKSLTQAELQCIQLTCCRSSGNYMHALSSFISIS